MVVFSLLSLAFTSALVTPYGSINIEPVVSAAASSSYRITNLGTLPGFELSWATGINNHGEVVGYVEDQANGSKSRAFVWSSKDGMRPLPGGASSAASDINNAGQIVGTFGPPHAGPFEAVRWNRDGEIEHLGVLPGMTESLPMAINQSGQVVGISAIPLNQVPSGTPTGRAFSWTERGGLVDIGPSEDPTAFSWANDVNARGQVVGYAYGDFLIPYAFSWHRGTMTDISSPDWLMSEATAINDRGLIVIRQTSHDFNASVLVWQASNGTVFGYANNSGEAINESGAVVGFFGDEATLWTPKAGRVRLNDLLPADSGWDLTWPTDINDRGQIVGVGEFNGELRAFLLEPSGDGSGQTDLSNANAISSEWIGLRFAWTFERQTSMPKALQGS